MKVKAGEWYITPKNEMIKVLTNDIQDLSVVVVQYLTGELGYIFEDRLRILKKADPKVVETLFGGKCGN